MKISELIEIMQKVKEEHGDCEVVVRSGDAVVDYTLTKGFKYRVGTSVWNRDTGRIVQLKNLFCIY